MAAEMTSRNVGAAGWLFYDGDCRWCCQSARRVESLLARRGFQLCPLQSREAHERLGLSGHVLLREMRLLLADGRQFGGADAAVEISRRIWWGWPLWLFSRFPGAGSLLGALYRVIAANRHCVGDACRIARRHTWSDWSPLLLLPAAVIAVQHLLPAWVFMWLLAFAIFLGCKWLTFRRAAARPARGGSFAYLCGWPGMDAKAFLVGSAVEPPRLRQWVIAGLETLIGVALLGLATGGALGVSPLLTGWVGMVGLLMMLHFGLFHLLSLGWRAAGRDVTPLMRAPLLATSLADFWGNRWNTAFNVLGKELVFRKLVRPLGTGWAAFAVFLVSGLVHDLVISLPARAGYGLPTAYFLLQGAAVLFERSRAGAALGLGHGWRGRAFALMMVAAPVFWLFHPPFVNHVILPMLQAIGSTWTRP